MVHYKEDLRVVGYKPMPLYPGGQEGFLHWYNYFPNPNPNAGNIESVTQYAQEKVCMLNYQ